MDGAVLILPAVRSLHAHRTALIIGCHLVLPRAVQHRTGSALAGDVTPVAGTGGAVVEGPLHARRVEEAVEEAAFSWRCDELPRPCDEGECEQGRTCDVWMLIGCLH